jgi:prepilin-type N-terminal cleavage/methylation domain-containing protein/prepilin-type processing-associated H-X9-DG protein
MRQPRRARSDLAHGCRGLTLVELLVVVAIVGVLVALLLPGVQAVREAGRRTQCHTNLRQLALACLAHEHVRGFLPSGGWGGAWVGDPDRGCGERQPGGWAFALLPHLEEATLHGAGGGLADAGAKADLVAIRLATPVVVFACPTRRPAAAWPLAASKAAFNVVAVPATVSRRPTKVVRGDYAANMGSGDMPNRYLSGGAPSSVVSGDTMTGAMWQSGYGPPTDGVVFRRSRIRLRDIPDGLSATYLLGEKYVETGSIATGLSDDDDQCLYSGHDRDVLRTGLEPPSLDRAGFDPVTVSGVAGSTNKFPLPLAFGSGHPGGCGMAMADGSVRPVAYAIDAAAHRAAASRNDAQKR